ncbi:cytochrome c, class I [Nitratireductor indicus C115]|uniref:Cytochrome c, class I n=1 Tax=Nitratireductor indicus C115 TaxID=1231190 RepID=K2PT79_9HYPH|nr:cytochrome c family protein [Nitratireductor indicus]EKF44317.1 cytochrome c, class I [Nitratireductor indicus C115]SFQ27361.1 cytochrome c [Nitratireductor indicus]
MNSFELNKILGALLGAVFVIFSINLVSDAIFHSPAPEKPGYAIEVAESGGEGAGKEDAAPQSIAPLLASADPAKGENIFKRCQACHTVEEGGANKVGPNLWEIVDRPIASHEGFSYSAGMKEFSEGNSKHWTYENLDHFLTNPKGFVSGTAMAFAGLKKIEDRADVIAYLRQHAANPVPFPAAETEGGSDASATPAEGAAPSQDAAPAEGATQDAAPTEQAPAEQAPAEQAPATDGATQEGGATAN